MEKQENIIELKHISRTFNDGFKAVSDFNLEVKRGEFVTFLGPSGCGKTTTLRMIAGFDMPTEGELLLNGRDISKLPPNERPINTVFQRYALFPHMNIFENIAFGLKIKKLPKEEIRKKVKKVLELVDLEGFEKRSVSTLSGGQQQRVAIARALAMKPQMLFFDEPTSALDPELTAEILKLLKELAAEKMTMLIVTHEIDFARSVSNHVVFMDGGLIVEQGKPQDVIDHPSNERTRAFLKKLEQ